MRSCLLSFLLLACLSSMGQQAPRSAHWKSLDFLIGDWIGKGGGSPGQGSGRFSFHFDLDQRVLVRRNSGEYPAANGRPAYHHEDLMVIYPEDQGSNLAADYFDSEGHIIRYRVQANDSSGTAIFVSEPATNSPGFRLTYKRVGDGLEGKFEIAPPGKPEEFKVYLQWTAAHDH